jgi:transposase InsO family protein
MNASTPDVVANARASGLGRLRVDDFTREALALLVDTSIGGRLVVRELDTLIAARRRPATIVSDNVGEFVLKPRRRIISRGDVFRRSSNPQWRLSRETRYV